MLSGLNAGGLLGDFHPPSTAALLSGRSRRPAVSTAREAAPALTSAAVRVSPLNARPVSLALSWHRSAEQKSENSTCDVFPAPRAEDRILEFSMGPVFFTAFGVDTDFHRDSSTDVVFTTVIQGGNAAQTGFRPRSAAGANTPITREGAENNEPPDSVTTTTPQGTDRSARRIARHAPI